MWGRGEWKLRQNRQEGYEAQEGKEQEARVLRGRQVGEKCKILAWAIKKTGSLLRKFTVVMQSSRTANVAHLSCQKN